MELIFALLDFNSLVEVGSFYLSFDSLAYVDIQITVI